MGNIIRGYWRRQGFSKYSTFFIGLNRSVTFKKVINKKKA